MNTWKVIFATMVIFGAGVVTGGLLVKHASPSLPIRGQRPASNHTGPASAGGLKLEFLRRVERELDVTEAQREQIDKILSASQERTRKIMEPVSPRIHVEIQQTKDQIRAVLTADQRTRFDELLKQQQRPREQHRPNHPPENSSLPFSPTGVTAPNP